MVDVTTAWTAQFEPGEVIHESPRHTVQRARRRSDGLPVVLKRLRAHSPGEEETEPLRREFALLTRLDIVGVIRCYGLLEGPPAPVLVLEEMGGVALDRRAGPMPVAQFLELAAGLAGTLAALHEQQLIHRNINPSNILFNEASGQFRLIDFALADELVQHTVAPQPITAIEGALAFISPEQTGRMNRAVDYRTDFYSLGVTFYWLLTGTLPFAASDDLGLVHSHIAAPPPPAHLRNPAVPEPLSRVVQKLMAKMAEQRYQSGLGLKADLERCLTALRAHGTIAPFEPGLLDFSDRVRMPQRLHGREQERTRLLAAFARAGAGGRELLLVAGYSGVGKTALVHEAQPSVLERRGYFLEGKFDQLRRNIPYSALVQAFEGFAMQLLTEEEGRLAQWRRRILDAVRDNGRVLTDVIPALERVIGPQPAAPQLGAGEAQNRFVFLFLDFIKAIASPEQPLLLFLDDLQWIDTASLNLLHELARAGGIRGLLVVGGYRDNEVDALHPLTKSIEALRAEGAALERLTLAPLSEATTNLLIADALNGAPGDTLPLTRIVFSKSGGNAFFTLQMLKSLAEQGAIRFDAGARRWRYDPQALARMEISDNVVALMVTRMRGLREATQQGLALGACLGFRFALPELATVADRSEAQVREALRPALRDGLLLPFNRHHYRFAHDRVRQAAYALVPDARKAATHLAVGRLLRARLSPQGEDEQLFTVADNLNAGAPLIDDDGERLALVRLNQRAGRKARDAAAFGVAAHYFREALRQLPADPWQRDYPLTLALHEEGARCAYMVGDYESADALIDTALGRAASARDKAGLYAIRVVVFTTCNRFADSMVAGLTALRLCGVDLPDPSDHEALRAATREAIARYRSQVARSGLSAVADAPPMSDPDARMAMELLVHMVLAAYFLDRTLYTLLTATMANLALAHGNSGAAALGFAIMAAISITELQDFDGAEALGRLALKVNERHPEPALEAKILMFYANTVAPWFLPLAEATALQRRGFEAAINAGALNDAANLLWGLARNALVAGGSLAEARVECDNTIAFGERIHDEGFRLSLMLVRAVIKCFQGELPASPSLSFPGFDEAAFIAAMEASGFHSTLAHYNLFKGWTLFALGHFDQARRVIEAGCATLGYIADQPHSALHYLHHSLLLLADAPIGAEPAEVAGNQARLALLAAHCPANYRHLHLLVEAERARVAGDPAGAQRRYDEAIAAAAASGNAYVGGIACELAGRFSLARREEGQAADYLAQALRLFGQWQAHAKVAALRAEFPRLLAGRGEPRPGTEAGPLDLDTVMKATRTISGEMELDRLVAALMRIVIENAGAERGVLLLPREEGGFNIVARGEIGAPEEPLPAPLPMEAGDLVSPAVVRFVARTRERVLLDDAAGGGTFAADPHIRRRGTRSLLCAPLIARGRLMGIFYLENDLTAAAFTPARVQLLETLLAQAAISLENARIYEALRHSEARYRRIVDTAMEGIMVLDPQGRISFANARMAGLLGHTPEEMAGRDLREFMFADDLAGHELHMAARRNGVAEVYERRFRCRDGRAVWVIASATPMLEAGRFQGSFGMYTDITERRRAEHELLRSNRFLRTLSRCNETLVHATEEQALLNDMCHVVVDSGSFAIAWVGYREAGALRVMACVDAHASDYLAAGARIDCDHPAHACRPAVRALASGAIQVIQQVADDPCGEWRERTAAHGYGSAIALPLRSNGTTMGVLCIAAEEAAGFGPDVVGLLSELASDLSFGIDGLRLRRDRERFMEQLGASMRSTIQALSATVELRDPYTAGHQRRVAELSAAVARRMGWPQERVQALYLAGMVHDIGKIAVPAEILSKPGQLTSVEFMLVRGHVSAGYDILKSVDFPWPIAEPVRQHHERLDGSGYPQGLKGDEICIEARVLAVCDTVEAMTTHRPYRAGLGIERALATIEEGAGRLFDPTVVESCLGVIREENFRFV